MQFAGQLPADDLHADRCAVWSRVNMVLTGAEGVVESGGVINKLGTYTIALAAKALNVPYYVAAESYKVPIHSVHTKSWECRLAAIVRLASAC